MGHLELTLLEKLGGSSLSLTLNDGTEKFQKKVKVVHSHGHMAKFKWVPNQANVAAKQYTGIFKGSDHGIVRLSSASKIEGNKSLPSMALKFLRDGQPSANLMVQRSQNPQDGLNFFKECMANH